MIIIELSVYIYHSDGEKVKEIQKFIAAVLFNADYHATVYSGTDSTKINSLIENYSSGIDILVLPVTEIGYALGQELRKNSRNATLLYYCGKMQDALDAFQSLPIAYVTEEADKKSFSVSVLRAAAWATKGKCRFVHESKTELIQYKYNEIDYFESNYRMVYIHLTNGAVKTITAKLDDVQLSLPGEMFCRCHKSYLVNLSKIEKVDKSNKKVHLASGEHIYASKSLYPDLITCLSGGVEIETL